MLLISMINSYQVALLLAFVAAPDINHLPILLLPPTMYLHSLPEHIAEESFDSTKRFLESAYYRYPPRYTKHSSSYMEVL